MNIQRSSVKRSLPLVSPPLLLRVRCEHFLLTPLAVILQSPAMVNEDVLYWLMVPEINISAPLTATKLGGM